MSKLQYFNPLKPTITNLTENSNKSLKEKVMFCNKILHLAKKFVSIKTNICCLVYVADFLDKSYNITLLRNPTEFTFIFC